MLYVGCTQRKYFSTCVSFYVGPVQLPNFKKKRNEI